MAFFSEARRFTYDYENKDYFFTNSERNTVPKDESMPVCNTCYETIISNLEQDSRSAQAEIRKKRK